MTVYKAQVTDKETGQRKVIKSSYDTKDQFIFDLRRNGYAVNPTYVKTASEFDRIVNTTNGEIWHWQPRKYGLKKRTHVTTRSRK